jgi:ABC-type proline/glycine betaine transport system permease subunit
MSRIDVLIGNHLPLYREVLASTFRAMRPDLLVRSVSADELEALTCEHRPLLVICSMVSSTITDCSLAWIALYPDDRDEALVSVHGVQRTIPNASVTQLLAVVDEVRASTFPGDPGSDIPHQGNHSFE